MYPLLRKKIQKVLKLIRLSLTVIKWRVIPFNKGRELAFVFNVSRWKRTSLRVFLSEYEVHFVSSLFLMKIYADKINKLDNKVIILWGYGNDREINHFAENYSIPVYHIEDGFVRSKGLGSMHTLPYSLCLDKVGMYFDSSKPSDLEVILSTYNFSKDQELISQAKRGIKLLTELGISKYNHISKKNIDNLYGPKIKKRILVIGQVEDDASIQFGSIKKWTNNDLVLMASKENPNAEIIYKPHPDVLAGRRKEQSNPIDVKHLAKIINEPLGLVDSLQTIDHVYTITSLSGFEALIRGIPVTTFGAPFYSGWGLTDDRQLVERRKRKLTIEEIFAGAYILYPMYKDPLTKEKITLEETIKRINNKEVAKK